VQGCRSLTRVYWEGVRGAVGARRRLLCDSDIGQGALGVTGRRAHCSCQRLHRRVGDVGDGVLGI
jgi:hypothetical protein